MQRIGRADDVVMYVHSEFGRRVPENTSLGTDHGTAQVNFVIGNAVSGGMYGKPPSLSELVLGDNLETTTDFRRVYATLIEDWLGADSTAVLGQPFERLGLFGEAAAASARGVAAGTATIAGGGVATAGGHRASDRLRATRGSGPIGESRPSGGDA